MDRPIDKMLSRATIGAFLLGPVALWSGMARAYYLGGSAGAAILVTTTTGGTTTTAGVVLLVVLLVRGIPEKPPSAGADGPTEAQAILDAALMGERADVGLQLTVAADNPGAFQKLDQELSVGRGASVDSLAQALSLSPATLCAAWERSRAGVVADEAGARAQVARFTAEIGEVARPSKGDARELAWSLAREQAAPEFSGDGATHHWLAHWLGVSEGEVALASRAVLAEDSGDLEGRRRIEEDAPAFLGRIAEKVQAAQGEAVRQRYAELRMQAAALRSGTATNAG